MLREYRYLVKILVDDAMGLLRVEGHDHVTGTQSSVVMETPKHGETPLSSLYTLLNRTSKLILIG